MAEIKLNMGHKGKTYKAVIAEDNIKFLAGKKIGDTFKGEGIDMPGYEFQITGGSDSAGFPMRKDVEGTSKKKILISSGVGLRKIPRKGYRVRKSVAGNTVYERTAQLNVKVIKEGKNKLGAEATAEEAKVESKE